MTNENTEEPARRGAAAFASRDFRLYQMARALVIMGAEAQSVAVAWQVYLITHRALDLGVTMLDTADVYGDGRSEQTIGRFVADNPDTELFVATKMGRRVDQVPENYVLENFRAWNDRSRANLGVDRLDLVQLHCPPTPVYSADAVGGRPPRGRSPAACDAPA